MKYFKERKHIGGKKNMGEITRIENVEIEAANASMEGTQAGIRSFAELDGTVTSGILFNKKGNMIVAKNGEIVTITPEGKVHSFVSLKEIAPVKNYYFNSPLVWDMVMDKSGNIIAAAQDRVIKISEEGSLETLFEDSYDGFLGCSGIELDADENIYYTSGSKIIKAIPGGSQSVWFDGSDYGYNSFFSLKFSPNYEKLYATDFYTSSMITISNSADDSERKPELIIREPIKNASPYGAPLNMIYDENGFLYCSIDGMSEILKVSKEGETKLIAIPGMNGNHYIAFGTGAYGEENVYVTTFDGKVIYHFPKALIQNV
jgi:sugar lactone lactonase YvrE